MIRAADPKTRPQVLEILDSARDLGLKVLRIWAFSEGPIQYNTLQRYPGASACLARPLAPASALWRIKGLLHTLEQEKHLIAEAHPAS